MESLKPLTEADSKPVQKQRRREKGGREGAKGIRKSCFGCTFYAINFDVVLPLTSTNSFVEPFVHL